MMNTFRTSISITIVCFYFLSAIPHSIIASEECVSLDGAWQFCLDPDNEGFKQKWYEPDHDRSLWEQVNVPHTWQVEPETLEYEGLAWYAREIEPDSDWANKEINIEFDAVYRDTRIWLNGHLLGERVGSGWTPFSYSLTEHWNDRQTNVVTVQVDNRFSEKALPYLDSFDWPRDGGIIRSVRLRILPNSYIERLLIHAEPATDFSSANVQTTIPISSIPNISDDLTIKAILYDPEGKRIQTLTAQVREKESDTFGAMIEGTIGDPFLWHFDHPHLYRMICRLYQGSDLIHEKESAFGIRKVEMEDGKYYLNGEPMRLMGVEWMPASDPRYGMAQDPRIIRQILTDMKQLNCVITRFHWQQDDSVFEFCDGEGILVQEEVPAWGPRTMNGNFDGIQEMHLREMILPHYLFTWIVYNKSDQPVGTGKRILPDLPPGSNHIEEIEWPSLTALPRVRIEIFRPTGYSVLDQEWK